MKNNSEIEIIEGLRVCYIEKPLFHKSYAGIGVNFGGRDIELMDGDKKVKLQEGTAHFIEHKLFQLEDGDAFEEFSKMGVNSNAYTDLEKTIYYFTTTSDLYEPLALLLKMYFTPVFKEEDIEREKEIIISEIKMFDDIPQTQFSLKLLKALYPNHPLASPIAGKVKSVKEIKKADLDLAYRTFYTIENSVLVVASNEPRKKVYGFIQDTISKLQPLYGIPKHISYPLHSLGKDFIYKAKVEQPTVALAIRFSANQNIPLFCNYIMGIFDSLFSPISPFFKKLYEKKAFIADIDYSVSTLRDTSYAIVSTTSNHPKLFLELCKEKLTHLTKRDIHKTIIELYIKHLKAKSVLALDSIEELAEEVLILALEGESYLRELDLCQQLSLEDFYPYLEYFKTAEYVEGICEKSTKQLIYILFF